MKQLKGDYDTSRTFLYQHCLKDWWPALDAQKKVISCSKGEIIFAEGQQLEGVYFMVEGVVKIHKSWTDDKELVIRWARENDIIGHRGLSTFSNIYPVTATALSDAIVCQLELDFFRSTLAVNAAFSYAFMMFFADELYFSEQRMRDLAHMPVKGRVAQALLAIESKFSSNEKGFISFAVSRQDIAAYTGAAYETVYKILTEWIGSGVIRTDGKYIGIADRKTLEALC
ncbi:MAG TPA: Crp/Fnr family transcriptional regulator [Puia sp.]|nr:Crp/Fnr family transcriptional regulator [Puia sp.]